MELIKKLARCLPKPILVMIRKTRYSFNLVNYYYFQYLNRKNLDYRKKQIEKNRKIRIGFYVVFDSVFPSSPLIKILEKNDLFQYKIIVIPDIARDKKHEKEQLFSTYNRLSALYNNVYLSFNKRKQEYTDYSKDFDVICFSNPYESMTLKQYGVEYAISKRILPMYISYASMVLIYTRMLMSYRTLNLFWLLIADNEINLREYEKYQPIKALNVKLLGYAKMDSFPLVSKRESTKKTIIIAPHHTIDNNPDLSISTFLLYSDFYLQLPLLYPEVNFVFRPHPLLFVKLRRIDIWGESKTEEYLKKLLSYQNVTYSDKGDYFELFANSDALIHDCGSFLLEYLFTDNPCCYLLKNSDEIDSTFNDLGKKCLEHYTKAYSEQDIITFIDSIVSSKGYYSSDSRHAFVNTYLKKNHPHVSETIVNYLETTLLSREK